MTKSKPESTQRAELDAREAALDARQTALEVREARLAEADVAIAREQAFRDGFYGIFRLQTAGVKKIANFLCSDTSQVLKGSHNMREGYFDISIFGVPLIAITRSIAAAVIFPTYFPRLTTLAQSNGVKSAFTFSASGASTGLWAGFLYSSVRYNQRQRAKARTWREIGGRPSQPNDGDGGKEDGSEAAAEPTYPGWY